MKQLDAIAPDFSELLQSIQAIIIVSKSFYHVKDFACDLNFPLCLNICYLS